MKRSRLASYLIIVLTYAVAIVGGYFLFTVLPFDNNTGNSVLLKLLIVDAVATVWVWVVGMIFNNASVYDPYWSVAPVVMIIGYAVAREAYNPYVIVIMVLIGIWGLRLTINWAIGFKNLHIQDWRYAQLQEKHPKLWFLISLFGICMMPTIVVFIAMLPAFQYVEVITTGAAAQSLGNFLGMLVVIAGITIETLADIQMHQFKSIAANADLVNDHGLWSVSRHPNYLGEIMFWFGICVMGISFYEQNGFTNSWVLIMSPIIVLLLFGYISIPMMEKRQLSRKPAYKEYKENTNMLLIFPRKSKKKKDQ